MRGRITLAEANSLLPTVDPRDLPTNRRVQKLALLMADPSTRLYKDGIIPPNKLIKRLAKKSKLTRRTVRKYMMDTRFQILVVSLLPAGIMHQEPAVWQALINKIVKDEDLAAIELYFTLIGRINKGKEATGKEFSIDELIREANRKQSIEVHGEVVKEPQALLPGRSKN